jgi:hypothetical protein
MNIILEYIYNYFTPNTIQTPIINKNKRKYNDCINTSNIILSKRIRKLPLRLLF